MYCKHAWLHRQAAAHTRALLYRACQILAAGSSFSARSWVPSRHCASAHPASEAWRSHCNACMPVQNGCEGRKGRGDGGMGGGGVEHCCPTLSRIGAAALAFR